MAEFRGHRGRRVYGLIAPIDASSAQSPARPPKSQQSQPLQLSTIVVPQSPALADFVPTSQPEENNNQDSAVQESIPLGLPKNGLHTSGSDDHIFEPTLSFEANIARSAAKKSSQARAGLQEPPALTEVLSTPEMAPKKAASKAAASVSKSKSSGHTAIKGNTNQHAKAINSTTKNPHNKPSMTSKEMIELSRAARASETANTQLGRGFDHHADQVSAADEPAARSKETISDKAFTSAESAVNLPQQQQKAAHDIRNVQNATPSMQTKPGKLTTIAGSLKKKLPSSVGPAKRSEHTKQGRGSINSETDEPYVYEVPTSPRGQSEKSKALSKSSKAQRKSIGRKKLTADEDDDGDYHATAKPMNVPTSVSRSLRSRKSLADSVSRVSANDIQDLQMLDAKKSTKPTKDKVAVKENALVAQESIEEFEESVTNVYNNETTAYAEGSTTHVTKKKTQSDRQRKPPTTGLQKSKNSSKNVGDDGSSARGNLPLGSQNKPIELSDHVESDSEQVSSEAEETLIQGGHTLSNKQAALQTPKHIGSSPPTQHCHTTRELDESMLVRDHDTRKPNIVHFSQDGPKIQGRMASRKAATSAHTVKALENEEEPASAADTDKRGSESRQARATTTILESILSSKRKPSTIQNHFSYQDDYTVVDDLPAFETKATFRQPDFPKVPSASMAITTDSKRAGDTIFKMPSKRTRGALTEEQEDDGLADSHVGPQPQESAMSGKILAQSAEVDRHNRKLPEMSSTRAKVLHGAGQEWTVVKEAFTRRSDVSKKEHVRGVEVEQADTTISVLAGIPVSNTIFAKQGQTLPTKPNQRVTEQDLCEVDGDGSKYTGRRRNQVATPTILAEPQKLSAVHEPEHTAMARPIEDLQETPDFVMTLPKGLEGNKSDIHATKASVAHESAKRIPSAPTVDINGSPVPAGYDVSGGNTVLQTFSQQNPQDDEDTSEGMHTPDDRLEFSLAKARPVEHFVVEYGTSVPINPITHPAHLRAATKAITVSDPQEMLGQAVPLRSPAESLRTEPFVNEMCHDNVETRTVNETTFMQGRKQEFRRQNEKDHADKGDNVDQDMDEDPDRTLVNEEDEEHVDAAEKHEVMLSSFSSSQSYIRDEEVTEAAMEVDESLVKWRDTLKSHQGSLFDQLVSVAHKLVSHLIDKETAVTDIIDDYSAGGTNLIEEMERKHSVDVEEYLRAASKNSTTFAKGYKQIKNNLAKDMEMINWSNEKYSKESPVSLVKVHQKLEEMIQQCG